MATVNLRKTAHFSTLRKNVVIKHVSKEIVTKGIQKVANQKCKFNEKCAFKHDGENDINNSESLKSENLKLKDKVKSLESEKEHLKKEIEMKDFAIITKNDSLNNMEREIKELTEEINVLTKDIEMKRVLIESMSKCEICDNTFESNKQLQVHIKKVLEEESVPNVCTKCEISSAQIDKLNVDVAVLTDLGRDLMDEKKEHKSICNFSEKCGHISACPVKCFYNDINFVMPESDFVESDESDSDESDFYESDCEESDNEGRKENPTNMKNQKEFKENELEETKSNNNLKCKECDFYTKSLGGLSKHRKVEHQMKCEECEMKTTTKALLKQHKAENHE